MPNTGKQPTYSWYADTGYDFFISLHTVFNPDKFDLRPSWAAGVRSRLPNHVRDVVERFVHNLPIPFEWMLNLPKPVNAALVLQTLSEVPPAERFFVLGFDENKQKAVYQLMEDIVARGGQWNNEDVLALQTITQRTLSGRAKRNEINHYFETVLPLMFDLNQTGELLLEGLQAYYAVFYAEEEQRILPALQSRVAEAQERATQVELTTLIEELSQGLRFDFAELDQRDELIFIPSFWTTPLTIFRNLDERRRWLLVFGARPANQSLVPGDAVPDQLYTTLKALADPTRLRILRYLSNKPQTPAQLARQLRLRAPTITHHLHDLRRAGLVQLTLKAGNERHYAARRERVEAMFSLLMGFLDDTGDLLDAEQDPNATEANR